MASRCQGQLRAGLFFPFEFYRIEDASNAAPASTQEIGFGGGWGFAVFYFYFLCTRLAEWWHLDKLVPSKIMPDVSTGIPQRSTREPMRVPECLGACAVTRTGCTMCSSQGRVANCRDVSETNLCDEDLHQASIPSVLDASERGPVCLGQTSRGMK